MRCKCCNQTFHPKKVYKTLPDGTHKFLRFEDMCLKCLTASYEELTCEDVIGRYMIQDPADNLVELIDTLYTYLE